MTSDSLSNICRDLEQIASSSQSPEDRAALLKLSARIRDISDQINSIADQQAKVFHQMRATALQHMSENFMRTVRETIENEKARYA